MLRQRLFAFLVLLLALLTVQAQHAGEGLTLKGYVLDTEGNPLPGAYVYDEGKSATTITDEEGYFELPVGGPARRLKADYVGFETLTYEVERPDDVQVLVMQAGVQLSEVTVTAGGVGVVKSRTNVFNTESVTAQALTRAACCNLSESFEANPSVDVSYSDAVTGAKQIQLLGLAGTYVQLLTENFPNLRGLASAYGLDYVPGPWMQSIQVSKGAASVRNGYESVTGQIDVEYKKPHTADPLLLNVFASDAGRYEGNAVAAVALNSRLSTALLVNYYREKQQHDSNGDTFLDMPLMESYSVMNRWHYQTPRFISQSGVKFLSDDRTSGQTTHGGHTATTTVAPYTIGQRVRRAELFSKNGLILDSERGESVAIIASGSYHDQQAHFASRTYSAYQSSLYAALLYESSFGTRHKLATGLNVTYDKYVQRGNVVDAYTPQWRNVHETVAGAYAEYTFKPLTTLTLMGGIRADHSSRHGWFATPRLHVKYDPAPWINFRLSAGKGYRSTYVLPENNYLLASSRTLHIADDLKQESAWNYGLSASLHLPVGGEELSVNAEWYYTDFQNQVVADREQDAHAVYFYNLRGRSTSSVVQLDASYPLFRGFTLLAAYRWMDVQATYGGRTLRTPLTSRYRALLTASYETPLRKWQFDVTVQQNGGGRMPTPDAERPMWRSTFPSYTRLNAQVTRRFRHWSIYAGGENLTDFRQDNPIVSAADPYGTDFDATLIWGPTMGRKLYAGIRYTLPKP